MGSVIVAHRLSCSAACGIFLGQGSNLCPLHWQGRFLTAGPPGKPGWFLFKRKSIWQVCWAVPALTWVRASPSLSPSSVKSAGILSLGEGHPDSCSLALWLLPPHCGQAGQLLAVLMETCWEAQLLPHPFPRLLLDLTLELSSHLSHQNLFAPASKVAGTLKPRGFCGGSDGKESACNAEDLDSIPGLGRSPGEGNGNPLQYSCLAKSHEQGSLVGYSPWGRKESDTAERLTLSLLKPRMNRSFLPGVAE